MLIQKTVIITPPRIPENLKAKGMAKMPVPITHLSNEKKASKFLQIF